jgi:rhomboid protease GluP
MPITQILILTNVIAYILQINFAKADLFFALNRYFYEAGLLWQPLTSMFLHGSLTHLAMNMVVLYQFGTILESARGKKYFLFLYIIGGILTSLLSILFMYVLGLNYVLVGASGAICVLIGWLAYMDRFNRNGLIVAILLISFAPLLLGIHIAWYAHIFGFIVGWIAAQIFK